MKINLLCSTSKKQYKFFLNTNLQRKKTKNNDANRKKKHNVEKWLNIMIMYLNNALWCFQLILFAINVLKSIFKNVVTKKKLSFVNFKKQIISKKVNNILSRFKHEIWKLFMHYQFCILIVCILTIWRNNRYFKIDKKKRLY